jgi:manganese-dependent inorganic pyrophosphatase
MILKQTVYVVGHKNPDTDSVCSALGYAALKKGLGFSNYVAARAGVVGTEACFLLRHFGLDAPLYLPDVKTKVQDVMKTDLLSVPMDAPIKQVYHSLQETKGKLAVIQRPDGSLGGIVTNSDLAMAFMGAVDSEQHYLRFKVRTLVDVLDGTLLCGNIDAVVSGQIFIAAMSPPVMRKFIKPGAIIITGDRTEAQKIAAEISACLIITGNARVNDEILTIARQRNMPVIVAPGDTYLTVRNVGLSRAVSDVMNQEPVVFAPEDLLSDVIKQTREARHRVYPVVNEKSRLVAGALFRDDIFSDSGRNLVLVDHNEKSQAVAGIEEAKILEIIDHHRLGDIQTSGPVLVRNEPVGSTATIIAKIARENEYDLPPEICGALLGAILSDTMVFRSPTCTDIDQKMANYLAQRCGEDPEKLGLEMLRAGSEVEDLPAAQLIRYNLKEYHIGSYRAAVGQCEVVDTSRLLERKDEILAEMDELCHSRELSVMIMMFTEIMRRGTHLLITGPEKALIAAAFKQKFDPKGFFLPGVLSRKMQIIPKITAALGG